VAATSRRTGRFTRRSPFPSRCEAGCAETWSRDRARVPRAGSRAIGPGFGARAASSPGLCADSAAPTADSAARRVQPLVVPLRMR
jgi:hypothetical protein